jgi:tRNA(Ile)-lysidine synthase
VLRLVGGERKPHALSSLESLRDRLAERQALRATTLHGCLIQSDGMTVSIKPEAARRATSLVTAN